LLTTYLDRILDVHRARAKADHRDLSSLENKASLAPAPRGFRRALLAEAATRLAVIAEIKRRSPSRGELVPGLDPSDIAAAYERGGATCLSVLTDAAHFGGAPDDLVAARAATGLPVLRKDFTVSLADVYDARTMGADAVLLIAAALDDQSLARFHRAATDIGLDALVEVHDEAELAQALEAGASLIGVNQRDLRTFEVDRHRAACLAGLIPPQVVAVAESGVRDENDAAELAVAGYHAVLVGESLLTSADPLAAVGTLRVARP